MLQLSEPTTDGTLLGGRLSYRQFRDGFRTGIEPVLLAASIPARPGQRVLEAGCGAGAALLCLCSRVRNLSGAGIEADPETAALAKHNWIENGLPDLTLHQTMLPALPDDIGSFDHIFANPPWHRNDSSASPSPRRDLARRIRPGLLEEWIQSLQPLLYQGGTLSFILPASMLAHATGLMHRLGSVALMPIWPRLNTPAKIIMLHSTLGSRSGDLVLPGLVLHRDDGRFTDLAESILREGIAMPRGQGAPA